MSAKNIDSSGLDDELETADGHVRVAEGEHVRIQALVTDVSDRPPLGAGIATDARVARPRS